MHSCFVESFSPFIKVVALDVWDVRFVECSCPLSRSVFEVLILSRGLVRFPGAKKTFLCVLSPVAPAKI